MESSELMSSAASASDGLTQTENDDTLSESSSEDTLNLVEGAILRTLRKHSSQPNSHEPQGAVETRARGGFHDARGEEQQSAVSENVSSSTPDDRALLANLLEQVKDLRRNQTPSSRRRREALSTEVLSTPKPARGFDRRRGRERTSSSTNEELRMTLEAAAMAAKAAADAAEAAAESVARNTEAIEYIAKSMQASSKKWRKSKSEKNTSHKAIARSNSITHWILGLTVVSTIAWRFGVAKVAKRVTSKLNDPLGYVGGLIGSGDEPPEDHKKKHGEELGEKANLLEKLPHLEKLPQLEMPSFLSIDSARNPNGMDTSDSPPNPKSQSKPEDVKKTIFTFGNLLQIRSSKN